MQMNEGGILKLVVQNTQQIAWQTSNVQIFVPVVGVRIWDSNSQQPHDDKKYTGGK